MTMPVQENFCVNIYAGWSADLSWEPGEVFINLTTGYTAALKIRRDAGGQEIQSLSSSTGEIILGSFSSSTHQWNIKIRLSAVRTSTVIPGIYSYDLLLKPAVGEPITLMEGKITFKSGITDTV